MLWRSRLYRTHRTDVLGGKAFGKTGPYERLVGKAYFQVDPKNPANAIIVDVDKAPRNEKGMVEFFRRPLCSTRSAVEAKTHPTDANQTAVFLGQPIVDIGKDSEP